jgi:hypothetical protein
VMTTAELTFFLLRSVLGWMDRVPVFERNVARGGLCICRERGGREAMWGRIIVGRAWACDACQRQASVDPYNPSGPQIQRISVDSGRTFLPHPWR